MDLYNEKDPGSIDPSLRESSDSPSSSDSATNELKSCADCRTTKTPLWRGGPNGPKVDFAPDPSLCNACGIRYRKRRRDAKVMGLKKKWKQRMMGEEEQAAVLLMALSSGLLYA